MKIYFSAAIAQMDRYGDVYEQIVSALEKWGHSVDQNIMGISLSEIFDQSDEEHIVHYRKVLRCISQADVAVFETSFPSTLHIGHEMSLALEKGLPIIALYSQSKEPCFFMGLEDKKIFWGEYTKYDLLDTLKDGLKYAQTQTDTRFNLFLSPIHVNHLDQMSKKFKMPKAGYVRKLLEEDREERSKL